VAQYEPGGKLTIWTSTQGTYVVRSRLAALLGIPLHTLGSLVPSSSFPGAPIPLSPLPTHARTPRHFSWKRG